MNELPASRKLLNITKAALDHCEAECERLRAALGNKYREGYDNALAEQHVEIERLRADFKECNEARQRFKNDAHRLRADRNAIIEECARVAENNSFSLNVAGGAVGTTIATAIRALKDKP